MARNTRRLNKMAAILVLVAMVMGGCAQNELATEPAPATTAPAAAGTTAATTVAEAAPTSGGSEASAASATVDPTDTVAPTVPPSPAVPTLTPMPLPPPRLLFRRPLPGQEQPLDAPIELTFDQPMDRASVEAAVTLSPTAKLAFTWQDDRTVDVTPGGGLERGTRYEVQVASTARNVEGTRMEEAAAFDFSTMGTLVVTQVQPTPQAEGLDPNTLVTVVFNRPVVPLTAISQQAALPSPLTFTPPVRGQGEWLNTSVFVFRPADGFVPATEYKARVAAGLTDVSGATLDQDYTWTFTTVKPAVVAVTPPDTFRYVGPTDPISATFNQPMDHASVQSHFSLTTGDKAVAGTFRWQGGTSQTAPETMIFQPSSPLPRETIFTARVTAGAQARGGGAGLERDEVWKFVTVENPSLRFSVENGEENVPTGESLRITFAGPMRREGFLDHLAITPQVTPVYTYWSEYDTVVELSFKRQPATKYTVKLDAETPDKYGVTLGKPYQVVFTTANLPAYASFAATARLWTYGTYTDTVAYATYLNVATLNVGLYRVPVSDFMQVNGFGDWSLWDHYQSSKGFLVRSWSVSVKAPPNKASLARFDLVDAKNQPLPPGLYYAELSAPEIARRQRDYQPSRAMFVKSGVNLTLKQTASEVVVWATDLATGQPVAGLPITLYAKEGVLAGPGNTDAQGLYVARNLTVADLWNPLFAVAGEVGDARFAIAYNGWDEGISPWNFSVDSEFWTSKYQGYLYTERPIYRPGQTVYFKGILRADDDASYSLPSGVKSVQITINDPQGKELFKKKLAVGEMGTFYDELKLADEAPLGYYYIEFSEPTLQLYTSASFQVAEYRKPEYQVAVKADRDAYLSGETINVGAESTYYFGGPVADAPVHWSALSNPYSFQYTCPAGQQCPWYSWTDYEWGSYDNEALYGGYGRLAAEGNAKTDAQGRVTFKVPADIAGQKSSQVMTLEASVTDVNGQEVSSRTAAVVHKGEFYVGVAPRGYLAEVGDEAPIDLLTVDWDGKPVAGISLTVTIMEHNWYSVRRQAEDGNYYWDWTASDVPVMTTTVTTGNDGKAVVAFVPKKAGSYRVRAVGRDSRENEIRSGTYLWVWGGDEFISWRQESNNRITLIADRQEYEVGDTAEILIASPYSGTVQALVTVERGHVLHTEVRELKSNSEVLRVPITEDYVPDVFVSVVIVQGADQSPTGLAGFKMGLIKLPVSVQSKALTITLTPDKDMAKGEHYGPRQSATYDVLATDSAGRPVEAELSLRLADLAVLALADETGQTLLDTFWRSRGLGVRTSLGLVVAMEPFNREVVPGLKGGGGGEGDGGLVRTQFADTAFWEPAVRTGKDGKAQVTVTLPDNLTTWRMQARGVTADTLVGTTDVDILSTLDLLVRPVLPRFFVVGDQAQLSTIVHNNTSQALEAEVQVAVDGLKVNGPTSQKVRVAAGDKAEVFWPVTVLPGDSVKVRSWASAGALYDGREDTLPVYRYSTPEVVATAGHLAEAGARQEIVQLPKVFDPTQGELTVQVNGSLTAATADALTYLEHFPWECTEQTVSRFLPNVLTYQALEEMGLDRPELRQKLSQMVGVAVQRLYAQQHYDGGWGWWTTDDSNVYLTSYVMQGLVEARKAKFVVDNDVLARAASYLRSNLPSVGVLDTHWQANRLAYALYVLAEYRVVSGTMSQSVPASELGLAVRLFDKQDLLSRYGRALLAVALTVLEPDSPERATTLLNDLSGDAVMSATGTHWEEVRPDYWNMNTDIRSTAIVVWALSRVQPKSELLPNAVRWLMAVRKEGHWESTHDTSWALLALVQYMRASGEMQGDFSFNVYLNGQAVQSGEVNKETIDETHTLAVDIARLLVDEGNRLVIERERPAGDQTGKGQLYYTADLKYYLPAEQVTALDRGIVVAREYSPVADPKQYVTGAKVGDVIQVRLTVIAPTDLYYVIVEDPLPAGCEGVDMSLKTTSVVGQAPELSNLTAEQQDRWLYERGWAWWYWSHSEMRDEKIGLFATYLPRGTYEYTYLMRASVPGEFMVMPATAYQMYFPEVFGRSDGAKFSVEE